MSTFDIPEFKIMMIEKLEKQGRTRAAAIAELAKHPQYGDLFRELQPNPGQPKKAKLRAEITHMDGIVFRSKLEAAFYIDLKQLLAAGEISGFCLQPKFVLVEGKEGLQAITYSADFVIFHNGRIKPAGTYEIVDTKGYETEQWKRTYKQFKLKFPQLEEHFTVQGGKEHDRG